jgi:hypothetical protein
MKATDPRLAVLANMAGVRPPHILFVALYRAALKEHFDPLVCAQAAQLELRHVQRIISVLDPPVQRKPRERLAKHCLSEGWQIPQDWLEAARARRFWPLDVCRTEADKFYNWHRMKGTQYADWRAAWLNWIDRSHRENGNVTQAGDASFADVEAQRAYLAKLK